jgi:hypothetical protein
VHDNPWVGIWCDYGMYGLFDIEDNCIIHNGSKRIQWEMRRRSEERSISVHRTTS